MREGLSRPRAFGVPMSYSTQKLGINFRPAFVTETSSLLEIFDFFEVAPEGVFPGAHSHHLQLVTDLTAVAPITFHGRSLSFASSIPLDSTYLADLKNVIERFKPKSYSDHFAFTRYDQGNVPLYLSPLPSHGLLDHLIQRSYQLRGFLGLPVHLENVADFFVSARSLDKYFVFVREFFNNSPSRIVLNLNSVIITAQLLNMKPVQFFKLFPLDQIESATLLLPESQNVVLARHYADLVRDHMLDTVDFLNKHTSSRALVIQRHYETDTLERIQPTIEKIARRVS